MYAGAKKALHWSEDEVHNVEVVLHDYYLKEKPYFDEAKNIFKIFPKGTLTFIGGQLVADLALDAATGNIANIPGQFKSVMTSYWQKYGTQIKSNATNLASYEFLKFATIAGRDMCFDGVDLNGSSNDEHKTPPCAKLTYALHAFNTVESFLEATGFFTKTEYCQDARKTFCNTVKTDFNLSEEEMGACTGADTTAKMDAFVTQLSQNPIIKAAEDATKEELSADNSKILKVWEHSNLVIQEACKGIKEFADNEGCIKARADFCKDLTSSGKLNKGDTLLRCSIGEPEKNTDYLNKNASSPAIEQLKKNCG